MLGYRYFGVVDAKYPFQELLMNSNAVFPTEDNVSKKLKITYNIDNRLIIERKQDYQLMLFLTVVTYTFSFMLASPLILFSLFRILYEFSLIGHELGRFFLSSTLALLFLVYFCSMVGEIRVIADLERITIDANRKAVEVKRERKGKVKLEKCYSTSVIKNVRIDVNSYNEIYIYLDSIIEPIYIFGSETSDNKKKLEIANRIAGLLGVPVIEKT